MQLARIQGAINPTQQMIGRYVMVKVGFATATYRIFTVVALVNFRFPPVPIFSTMH
jgi:hypothetical protein